MSESIQVGDSIVVSVVRIEGDRVRIGITAPPEIRVIRGELIEAVADENLRASRPAAIPFALKSLKPLGNIGAAPSAPPKI